MPIFRHLSHLELRRNLRAFLRLETGVVRGKIPDLQTGLEAQSEKLQSAPERIRQQRKRLEMKSSKIKPENIVWIFGSARTGSTWLARMMGGLSRHAWWDEPYVGQVIAMSSNPESRLGQRAETIFGAPHREAWVDSVRSMVLGGAAARFPKAEGEDYLVIKEPNGSMGAPMLMEALPESRVVFLIRDPRDVVSSILDSAGPGGWRAGTEPSEEPNDIIKRSARTYMKTTRGADKAFQLHQGHKAFARYEELRTDTLATMKNIYASLGIAVEDDELTRSVEKRAWENIPEKSKGKGEFFRKAAPGSWREDLTPEQVEIVENATAPMLKKFYSQDES